MDLSWCIICDNRVDDVLVNFFLNLNYTLVLTLYQNDSSLYCSDSCRIKDRMSSITHQLNMNYQQQKKTVAKPNVSTMLRSKRSSTLSTSYPWVPLYRRRHSVVMSKRCQPVMASSCKATNVLLLNSPNHSVL